MASRVTAHPSVQPSVETLLNERGLSPPPLSEFEAFENSMSDDALYFFDQPNPRVLHTTPEQRELLCNTLLRSPFVRTNRSWYLAEGEGELVLEHDLRLSIEHNIEVEDRLVLRGASVSISPRVKIVALEVIIITLDFFRGSSQIKAPKITRCQIPSRGLIDFLAVNARL